MQDSQRLSVSARKSLTSYVFCGTNSNARKDRFRAGILKFHFQAGELERRTQPPPGGFRQTSEPLSRLGLRSRGALGPVNGQASDRDGNECESKKEHTDLISPLLSLSFRHGLHLQEPPER